MEFTYHLRRNPCMVLDKVCSLAQDRLVVNGDGRAGRFSGVFEGTYCIDGETASIRITRKPIFVSWGLIDEGLRYLVA